MPLGWEMNGSGPIVQPPPGDEGFPSPIVVNWSRDALLIHWEATSTINVTWRNDTTLAITHEPGVEEP